MAFSFGFAGDDSDEDVGMSDVDNVGLQSNTNAKSFDSLDGENVKQHNVADLLSSLPERIAYSTLLIETASGNPISIPRRELFDIRIQLIAEGPENDHVVDHLEKSDLRSGIYEGGFKTWECSIDLASLLASRDVLIDHRQVIELGAGSAIPSLVLFQQALTHSRPIDLVLADYNEPVLRLVTLPNLFLTWATFAGYLRPETPAETETGKGDLEISSELKAQFLDDLQSRSVNLQFLSGSWSPKLASLIPTASSDAGRLVLAAETIYSPASTATFVDLLITLLGRSKQNRGIVAAKRFYFGVGGSVDGLKDICSQKGVDAVEIDGHGVPGLDAGVGRALLEVQMT